MNYDVAVIGAGIVGSAIARELSGHQLSVALLEARDDVGDGTSKANTAILHTGFDAKPGTLESAMVSRGYHLLSDYATHTGIPIEHTGAILVAWDGEQLAALPGLKDKAEANGYHRCEIVDSDAVYAAVPHLGPGALGGLTVPDESIICTWTVNLALATDAVNRGAALLRNHRVESIEKTGDGTVLHTTGGPVSARWVINAAGLGADVIDGLFGHSRFTVTPRRGELIVYDKLARPLVDKIVLPVPTSRGKGVLVSPTIYGNVMLGPTSEDLTDRTATGTSETGFEFLLEGARAHAATARRGGHRDLRRVARGHRPRRLPDRGRHRAELSAGRRHPLDRADRGHGHRGIRSRPIGFGRAHTGPTHRPARATTHAQPRRSVPPAVSGGRQDRRRPGLRPHRVLLRARHRG